MSSHFFLYLLLGLREVSVAVAHLRGARAARVVSIDTDPLRLELLLDKLEPIEGAHPALRLVS